MAELLAYVIGVTWVVGFALAATRPGRRRPAPAPARHRTVRVVRDPFAPDHQSSSTVVITHRGRGGGRR